MAGNYPPGEYVGLEYESETVYARQLEGRLAGRWATTHDGSIESDQRVFWGVPIDIPRPVSERFNISIYGSNSGERVAGTEVVSPPLEFTPELEEEIELLTGQLAEVGATGKSDRAGIHIHVSMPISLTIVKNILALGSHMEDLFFKVAGMGYQYRGSLKNSSMYCRPITGVGPHHILQSGRTYQLYSVEDSLLAKSLPEFWERYAWMGYPDCLGGSINKYYPARYSWLNLYSLLLHNTLEFRVFNETLNPSYIYAVLELCVKFCSHVLKNSFPAGTVLNLSERSVFSQLSKSSAYAALDNTVQELELTPKTAKTLEMLIRVNPDVNLEEERIYTHCNMSRFSVFNSGRYPKLEIRNEPVRQIVVDDIHARRGERS